MMAFILIAHKCYVLMAWYSGSNRCCFSNLKPSCKQCMAVEIFFLL